MNKILILFISQVLGNTCYGWDFGFKGDLLRSSTSNANLTRTLPIADTFTTFDGSLQVKNESLKIKFKGKKEQYIKQRANDNYSTDLSLQYKHSKNDDYTVSIFNQVYNGSTLVSTDTTSDNSGGKFTATFTKEMGPENSIYFSPFFASKKYPKLSNRSDKILSASVGGEYNVSSAFLINPEIAFQINNSSDAYYGNTSIGPLLSLSFNPNDSWEYFFNTSYSMTNYKGRTVTATAQNRGRSNNTKEHQQLLSADSGIIYSFFKYISLQAKYGLENNTSNNATAAYKAQVTTFSISLKI